MDADVEMKPVEEVKDELHQEQTETQQMDTSEALSELNGTNEIKSESPQKENSENANQPRIRKKRKKGKKIVRSKDYPKYYQNAYVRFCNETRPKVCVEKTELDPVEVTKLVANMWYTLPKEEKQPYLDQAKVDKERFKRELKEFQRLNPDNDIKTPGRQKGSKKKQRKEDKSVPTSPIIPDVQPQPTSIAHRISPVPSTSKQQPIIPPPVIKKDDELPKTFFIGMDCELPIFTDAFLEHNKTIEAELKILRKNNVEMEQQNSVLMKHVENMENGVRKVESEIAQNKKKNMALEVYLTKLRCLLAANFNSLSLPGSKSGATVENIDKYMNDLSQEAKKSHSSVASKARDILKNIDLKITP